MPAGRSRVIRRRICLGLLVAVVSVCPCSGLANIQGIVVTSAASFELGMPAKGSIASVFCTGVQVDGIVLSETLPLPWTLAGVRVWVGGAPAPLYGLAGAEGYQQINIQVPQEAELGAQDVEVIVEQNGQQGSARVPLRLASPGDFLLWPGTNYGIFQHGSDYSLVTPESPAQPGETLVTYLTGMPGTTPTVPTGEPSPSDPPAIVPRYSLGYSATDDYGIYELGDPNFIRAETQSADLVPGLVGVYEIRLVAPTWQGDRDKRVFLMRTRCVLFGGCREYLSSSVTLPVR